MLRIAYIYHMIYLIKEGESAEYIIETLQLRDGDYTVLNNAIFINGEYERYTINKNDNPIKIAERVGKEKLPMLLNGVLSIGKVIWLKIH